MSQEITIEQALTALAARGFFFEAVDSRRSLTLQAVAERIGFSRAWVADHLAEFPNAWRAPGGGMNGGELRVPERDVLAFERRRKVAR